MKFNANKFEQANKLLASRRDLAPTFVPGQTLKPEAEGGCGVTGFAASVPVSGRHIFQPSIQMHNRGNGKGGGIAAVGLDPDGLGRQPGNPGRRLPDPARLYRSGSHGPRWKKNSLNLFLRVDFARRSGGHGRLA